MPSGPNLMEMPDFMKSESHSVEVKAVDMHTCGEPTRIIFDGFPRLKGTILDRRSQCEKYHDHIRRAVLQEPRGHPDMYGAVLLPDADPEPDVYRVDMAALFLTNEGYSTMCGHATIAIGRLLADHVGSRSFQLLPEEQLDDLKHDLEDKKEVYIHLRVPCGVVDITVPVIPLDSLPTIQQPRWQTDTTRRISYLSVPSFATGISVSVKIPRNANQASSWPELGAKDSVMVDIAYGGAFYLVVSVEELGFNIAELADNGSRNVPDLVGAATLLRRSFLEAIENEHLKGRYLTHPEHRELEDLYGVIITGRSREHRINRREEELALCVFANEQIDRSPTGSGVQARIAIMFAKGQLELGMILGFESLVSEFVGGDNGFLGEAVEEVDAGGGRKGVIVRVSGKAHYTACSTFVVEAGDAIGKGFVFNDIGPHKTKGEREKD